MTNDQRPLALRPSDSTLEGVGRVAFVNAPARCNTVQPPAAQETVACPALSSKCTLSLRRGLLAGMDFFKSDPIDLTGCALAT